MIRFKFRKILIGFFFFAFISIEIKAQCKNKTEPTGTVAGEFSINGTKVQVVGDGDDNITAANNMPIKICEGETITLKNTISATNTTGINYWLMSASQYTSLSAPPSDPNVANARYNSMMGDVSITINTSLTWYTGPGRYVLTQGDNSGNGTINDYHHACQVIEIIKSTTPIATASVCTGNEIRLTLPVSPNNNYEEYDIEYTSNGGSFNVNYQAKPNSYPYITSSGVLPDNFDRTISVMGKSKTGFCPAPPFITTIAITGNNINLPIMNSISGTAIEGEFNLAILTQNGIDRKVFIRDPITQINYDYAAPPHYTYTSSNSPTFESIKISVPNPQKQYCFITQAIDNGCPSTSTNPSNLSQEELCTTPAKVIAVSNKNIISWEKALSPILGGVFAEYRVERFSSDGITTDFSFLPRSFSNISDISFTDTDIKCGYDYYYRVTTNYGSPSVSKTLKITAISDDVPIKIPLVFADVNPINKTITVKGEFYSWSQPDPNEIQGYKFYKANSPTSNFQLLQTTGKTVPSIIDNATLVDNQSYCYYMTWENLCKNESLSFEKFCSIYLSSSGSILNWTPESAFSTNTEFYRVNKIDPSNGSVLKPLINKLFTTSINLSGLPDSEGQEIYLQIEAKPSSIDWTTTPSTHSNIVRIYRPATISIPQVFTPNNDGYNDKFVVYGRFIDKLKMTILDRWGNTIFYDETNDFDTNTQLGWDGNLQNGQAAQEGAYIYKILIEDKMGQVTLKEGAIYLNH
jgi:gliding motility-associated-like protein